ncbi:hypothetical protein [Thermoanaerobacterium sp. DL9XJH110]|uniref:hypothetical protein n=1 Tax=Thermoanaerobacterium sp. DL9XJH110 TaxID=3386643 RepID=UPI003BB80A2B
MGKYKFFNPRHKNPEFYEEKELNQRDFPLVRQRLLENSLSNNYDDACKEWDLDDIIGEDSVDFTDRCELCNQPGLKTNFIISNNNTGKSLKVGSKCITRFLILPGASNHQESAEIFEHKKQEIINIRILQTYLGPVLCEQPTSLEVYRFKNASKNFLGSLNASEINPIRWQKYITALFGKNNPEQKLLERVKQVLFGKVKVKKEKLETGEKAGHWSSIIKVKKTRVQTTLSKSSAYRSQIDR